MSDYEPEDEFIYGVVNTDCSLSLISHIFEGHEPCPIVLTDYGNDQAMAIVKFRIERVKL